MKKIISILLSTMLILGTVPAFADDATDSDLKNQVTVTADIKSVPLA